MDNIKYQALHADDINSDFGDESSIESKRNDLVYNEKAPIKFKGNKQEVIEEYSKEEFRKERFHILTLDAYSRHKKYINDYLLYYGGNTKDFKRDSSHDKTDFDVIKENHKFLWQDDEFAHTWELKLAKKYYDKLFKEYCIADLSLYKHNKIAMRWRIEKEVISGKGQFVCGEKKCNENEVLKSWEVNFGYLEEGLKKNALVKLRLCSECSYKLNYRHKRKEARSSEKRKHDANEIQSVNNAASGQLKIPKLESSESNIDGAVESTSKVETPADNIWSTAEPEIEEKSRNEEFDEYFQDMFL